MTDQICPLGSVWSALSEYHIRFYVRPSESTVWIWFRNYSCLDFAFLRDANTNNFEIKFIECFLKVVHKIWCDILKEQIKVTLEDIFDQSLSQMYWIGRLACEHVYKHFRCVASSSALYSLVWLGSYWRFFCCDFTMFAQSFKGFIIIGKIWKFNTVCLETSSTNKLKWSSLKLYFGGYKLIFWWL